MKRAAILYTAMELRAMPLSMLCGVDEAGRGPVAGPVTAAAVILPDDFPCAELDDSKALSAGRRNQLYDLITARALDWAIGWGTVEEIGTLNILGATMLAMQRAVLGLRLVPNLVMIDGVHAPELACACTVLPKADALLPSVMAASILAKVARDRCMDRLNGYRPEYGFSRHRGYPTEQHLAAIRNYGPSPWQRQGFRCGEPDQLLPGLLSD